MEPGKKSRPPRFKFEFPGDDIVHKMIKEKMDTVRQLLMQKLQTTVNNKQTISVVLDHWISDMEKTATNATELQTLHKNQVNQDMFLTVKVSQEKLTELIENHTKYCKSHLKNCKDNLCWTCYVCQISVFSCWETVSFILVEIFPKTSKWENWNLKGERSLFLTTRFM